MIPNTQEILISARDLASSGALRERAVTAPWRWSVGLQVLLVEDDQADAYLIRRALAKDRRVGEVILAEDGVEALEMCEKRRFVPDLAIVDLHMPRKDGLALLKDFATRGGSKFRSVVLTSSRSNKDALRAAKVGAAEFITKPKTEAELAAVLDRAIGNVILEPDRAGVRRREVFNTSPGSAAIGGRSAPARRAPAQFERV